MKHFAALKCNGAQNNKIQGYNCIEPHIEKRTQKLIIFINI